MNREEQRRSLVIAEMDRGTLSVGEGGAVLGVSARQARRLLAAYRQRGIAALVRGNRGRVPVNAVDEETRQAIIAFATERYAGFNHVHLTEQLGEQEGIALSRSSVPRILGAAGISSPRAHGVRPRIAAVGHAIPERGCSCRLMPVRTIGWKDAAPG